MITKRQLKNALDFEKLANKTLAEQNIQLLREYWRMYIYYHPQVDPAQFYKEQLGLLNTINAEQSE